MNQTDQAIQLFVVVALLIVAYFGVMVWTRRAKNQDNGQGGGGLFGGSGGGGGMFGGSSDAGGSGLDDDGFPAPGKKTGAKRNKGRFELQGRDAEIAAKVLKRMLKQDAGFKRGEKE